MSGDLLEELKKNRQRVVVPERGDPLLQKPQLSQDESKQGFNLDIPNQEEFRQVSNNQEESKRFIDSSTPDSLPKADTHLAQEQEELLNEEQEELLNIEKEVSNYPSSLRRLTVRMDEEVCLKLDTICSRQTLTPETLIEALFCQFDTNPNLMKKVLKDAKERYKKRKQAGVKKRTASMQQKYGE